MAHFSGFGGHLLYQLASRLPAKHVLPPVRRRVVLWTWSSWVLFIQTLTLVHFERDVLILRISCKQLVAVSLCVCVCVLLSGHV